MEYAGKMSRRAITGVTNDNTIMAIDTELNCTTAIDKHHKNTHTTILIYNRCTASFYHNHKVMCDKYVSYGMKM